MVPTVEFPPLTLSTDQVTAVFVVPVTLAVNGIFLVATTLTVDWFNVMLTTGGGWVVDELLPLEQPDSVQAIARARKGPENFLLKALDFMAFINCLRVSVSTSRGVDARREVRVAVVSRLVSRGLEGCRNWNYRVSPRVRGSDCLARAWPRISAHFDGKYETGTI